MNQEVLDWKNSGAFFRYKEFETFYFQVGNGEDLFILHGYPYSSFEWKNTIEKLSKKYRITGIDLLGMGFSDKPENHNYNFPNQCEIIDALLKKLNITKTHFFSHDLGVSVVQELIAREQESKNSFKILSSAFMNGGLFMDVYRPRLIQRLLSQTPKFIGKIFTKLLNKKSVESSVLKVFGEKTKPSSEFLDIQWDILNYNQGLRVAHLIGRMVFDKNLFQKRWIEAMQTTKIPLCYICGPADPNSGIHMANRYKELIPNPQIFILQEDIGHWPQLEDEKGVLEAYEQFRNKIS
ncbi:alpha/beta fold hydrolase [Leptospira sp. GIMC2001]|uniref:alpha/beta fold hydrolase n=1 Tax=Leptospira sp. GIMC2001 TaxID=1513297 RepID=UPI00234B7B09|nr:alpha/beta hydrolase [Leptospira sp. GIMC2001]WCL50578.1 alpha/beta hydrolase [Leptospira sp. GIMC2001]